MANYTYSVVNCTTDSYLNTCATGCCTKISGGILDPVTQCALTPSSCAYNIYAANITTVMKYYTCDKQPIGGNICGQKCCLQYGFSGLGITTNATACYPNILCQGVNPALLTPLNLAKYSSQIGQAFDSSSTISGGGNSGGSILGGNPINEVNGLNKYIGPIIGLSVISFIMLILMLIFCILYRIRNQGTYAGGQESKREREDMRRQQPQLSRRQNGYK